MSAAQRIDRLALHQVDRATFEGSRAQRRDDLLLYLAMMQFSGLRPPPLHALPDGARVLDRLIDMARGRL